MTGWTFLTNHALVLSYIAKHPRVTAREIAAAVGITERATRKIIADLSASGYVRKTREGRRSRYDVEAEVPLRHQMQWDTSIGELLKALGWHRRRFPASSRGN